MVKNGVVTAVKHKEFESIIQDNEIVCMDFWASWCAPCKQFADVYERVAGAYDTVFFGKVNVEDETELAELFQIRSIPHLMVFKEGIAIYSESGSMPESTFKELIEQAIAADVSDIRAQLDEEAE